MDGDVVPPVVDDSDVVGVLLRAAGRLLSIDPLAAVDVLTAALRVAPPSDLAAVGVQLAAAQWAAGRFAAGERVLQSILLDAEAPAVVRRDVAVTILVRQLGQIRLGAAAETIRVLLDLPLPIDVDERAVLSLLAQAATKPLDRRFLSELTGLTQAPHRGSSVVPAYALPFLTGQVIYAFGAVDEAIELARLAASLALGDAAVQMRALLAAMLVTERPDEADELLQDLDRTAGAATGPVVVVVRMFASMVRADWAGVDRCQVELGSAGGGDGVVAAFRAFVSSVRARVGGDAAIADQIQVMAAEMIDPGDWLSRLNLDVARANTALARGSRPLAVQALVDCIDAVEASGAVGLVIKFCGHVGTLLDAGRRDLAGRLAALIDEAADRHPSPVLQMYRMWKDALLSGDPDLHVAAVRAEAVCCLRCDRAELAERAGTVLLRAGHTAEAVEMFRAAIDAHTAAEAWEPVSRVRAQLRACGVRLYAPRQAGETLSHTESAVAALARRGLTNASIASRLGMSVGTVGTHLSRIYRKLGVSSRTELAAASVE